MKKVLLLLSATLLLSGCLGQISRPATDTAAQDYYLLDARSLRLCKGESTRCFALAPVASARTQLRPLELRYGQSVSGPNYPLNLARMLINPPDGSYESIAVDDRHYRLPMNAHTDTAWRTLENIYRSYYNN